MPNKIKVRKNPFTGATRTTTKTTDSEGNKVKQVSTSGGKRKIKRNGKKRKNYKEQRQVTEISFSKGGRVMGESCFINQKD